MSAMLLILVAGRGAGKSFLIHNTFVKAHWRNGEGESLFQIGLWLEKGEKVVIGLTPDELLNFEKTTLPLLPSDKLYQVWNLHHIENPLSQR